MVSKSVLIFFFCLYTCVDAQGNCEITDPEFIDYWTNSDFYINITDVNTNYKLEITTKHIKSASIDHKYIEANVANNILTFTTKEEFKNFIQNEDEEQFVSTIMNFSCENEEALATQKYLTLNVIETQHFEPNFENPNYNFKLSMPITPNQIIESTAMLVTDFNIDEKLTFTFIDGECKRYFAFDTIRNSKRYITKMKTIDHVYLDKSITCEIEVKDKANLGDTAQIKIEVDVQNSKVPNPIFKEPITTVNYNENLNEKLDILSSTYTPIPRIQPNEFSRFFDSDVVANNQIEIKLKEPIPEDYLENINYFFLIVEVEYDKADNIAKTVMLVDLSKSTEITTTSTTTIAPECTTTIISTTPCDCSTAAPNPGSSSTISTTLESSTSSCPSFPDCTTTNDPGNASTCPTTECPETTTLPFEITTCPTCPETTTLSGEDSTTPSNCDCTTSPPTTCTPGQSAPQIRFLKKSSLITLDNGSTGWIDTFKAESDITDEEFIYNIKSVEPAGAKNYFEFNENGDVYITNKLDEGTYYISLSVTGKQSKSQDEAMLFLLINQKIINCPNNTIQVNSLINTKVKEGESKILINANGNNLQFTTDNDAVLDWFKFNSNGDLEVQNIDREDERIKSLLAPQIQIKVKASKKNTPTSLGYNFSENLLSQYAAVKKPEYSCLNIRDIGREPDTIVVLVNVEDMNDNSPVFIEKSPLVVGYPEPKLVDLIAPPYLVKVTATDDDFGDYAKIKYTTNNKKIILDSENGIIFLENEISDNSEFNIIAEDNNGNGGNKDELLIKVKILKEEHISIIIIENIAYSEIDNKIKELSSLTNKTVKYLSSTALPKVRKEENNLFKVYSNDEKVPVVRIILYALDNMNEIISAKDFKKIADDIDLGIEIKIEEYIAALQNDEGGYIAAVSTLSVLLALVIIGGLLGYIFYLRPRMMETGGYIKHTNRDSIHAAPIQTKMESTATIADRRPTGFVTGFNPKDFDDEDYNDYETIKEEEQTTTKMEVKEQDEGNKDSKISLSTESEQKSKPKSGVKFDTNVTEIEIEEF